MALLIDPAGVESGHLLKDISRVMWSGLNQEKRTQE